MLRLVEPEIRAAKRIKARQFEPSSEPTRTANAPARSRLHFQSGRARSARRGRL